MTDLNLSEIQAEILASHLQERNLLQKVVKVIHWKCPQKLSPFVFLRKDSELFYFNDKEGFLQDLACTHNPEQWRDFL